MVQRHHIGLSYLKKNSDTIAITPFDKGQGFVSIKREKLVEKSEKEFKNVSKDTEDNTDAVEKKIQRTLRDLHKEGKIDTDTYKNIYPSGSLTPTANPAIKAHKPEKDYPARLITSHIDAPQESLASFLNDILKPFIQKSKYGVKNSFEFIEKVKKIKIGPNERMISYDATALFPSVPINDAIVHIRELLDNDTELSTRTKLNPDEISELIALFERHHKHR